LSRGRARGLVTRITETGRRRGYRFPMMILREITIRICQLALFGIGMGIAGLSAHPGGDLVAWAFDINDIIPTAVIFFAVAAALGWGGNRFWPETWLYNPLL
jgi:hypothetical protein